MGPFDYHIFAHTNGRYQTAAASRGVTSTERAALEQFFFGQTNDQLYLDSLAAQPGLIWRRPAERFLITRVVRGEKDANDRDTLRFESLLVGTDRVETIASALEKCVVSKWELVGDKIELPSFKLGASAPRHHDAISDVLACIEAGDRLVRPAEEVSLKDVEKIVRMNLHRDGFSLCYRSLNDQAPVQINFTSSAAIRRVTRTIPSEQHVSFMPMKSPQRLARATTPALVMVVIGLLLNIALLSYLALRLPERSSLSISLSRLEDNLKGEISNKHESTFSKLEDLSKDNERNTEEIQKSVNALSSEHSKSNTELSNQLDLKHEELKNMQAGIEQKLSNVTKAIDDLNGSVELLQTGVDDLRARPVLKEIQDKAKKAADRLVNLRLSVEKLHGQIKKTDRDTISKEVKAIIDELQKDLKFINPEITSPN